MGLPKIQNAFSDTRTATIQRNFDDIDARLTEVQSDISNLKLSAAPGGSNDAIQFNNSGNFGGGNFYWDNSISRASIIDTGKNVSFFLERSDGSKSFWNSQSDRSSIGTSNNFSFRISTNGLARMTINTDNSLTMANGASLTAGGVWTNASSIELKDEISDVPLDDCLEILKSLRPVYFRYVNSDERHVGFIAEELHEKISTKDRKGVSPVDILATIVPVLKYILEKIEG